MNINSNILWSLISIIASLSISYLFYKLSLKKKSITYDITTSCLISKEIVDINGLSVSYNSSALESLNQSTIKIKNSGNTIIDKNDIAPKTPISISTKGKFLYNMPTIQLSNDDDNIVLKFEVDEVGTCSSAIIDFDFISKKQTIEFSVLHTKNIKLNGRIKDGDIIEIGNSNITVNDSKTIFNFGQKIIPAIIFSFIACFVLSIIISTISYQKQSDRLLDELRTQLEINSLASEKNEYDIEELIEYIYELENEVRQLNPDSSIIPQQNNIIIQ